MKKILIIGGTRFFGKRLVYKLLQQQQDVTIMTRGSLPTEFEGKVTHIQCDRTNKEALAQAIGTQQFDVVYDNVNYGPHDAQDAVEIFSGKTKRYIFTSTLSVHEADGIAKSEKDFAPYTYPVLLGERNEVSYGEGKRLAEAVFFQKADFPVVAVRFPIVMGEDDYTERLLFHIKHVQQHLPISFINIEAKMGFITSEEAADFLLWAGNEHFVGPIHAASTGIISNQELIQLIEESTGEKAIISLLGDEVNQSPYAIPKSWYLKTNLAQQLGYNFTDLHQWLPELIKKLV
ncbi:MAG: NAD-dependent epimerase/dehydratase family protein [Kurthia sp.]|nr:NAD-dependent epimerase/dehydratase family protein [Candidatus Kurthia equi]